MRQKKILAALFIGTSLLPAPARAQTEGCTLMLLPSLLYGEVQIGENEQSFLNVYSYCLQLPQSEDEARGEGVDLARVYATVIPQEPRFKTLQAWAVQGCQAYLAQGSATRLQQAIATVLARAKPSVARGFERCTKDTGLSCYAVPAGPNVVGLFLKWSPPGPETGQSVEPEILSVSVTGAMQPLDLLETGTSPPNMTSTVESLEGVKVPRTGLLRSFLRTDKGADVIFEVKTGATAAECITEKVGPTVPHSQVSAVGNKDDEQLIALQRLAWIDVQYLQEWIDELSRDNRLPKADAHIADLIPFIDGVPLVGIHPTNLGDKPEVVDGSPVRRLRFDIERNEKNREAWSQLLRLETLGFKRPVKVTVGFENGETLDTLVTYPGTGGGKSQAYLRVIPGGRAILGLLLIGGGLVFFLLLAAKTDIVRDTTVRYRPDGRSPFSLGRAQMAFWFFLVVLSYFVLWMVTGDKDTITDSTAVLIGISAATALGAAYADSRKTDKEDKSHSVAAIEDLSKPRRQILALLERNRTSSIEHCRRLRQERDAIAPGETEALAAKNREIEKADSQLAILEQQIRFFHLPAWRRVFDDLLTENEGISFHKFQIFVWTLILGVIFIYEVLINLAMPEFNTTLLAIMGISGGTYIGFKLPSGAKTDQ